MRSYREHVSKQEKFSIRKLSVGVVSLAILDWLPSIPTVQK